MYMWYIRCMFFCGYEEKTYIVVVSLADSLERKFWQSDLIDVMHSLGIDGMDTQLLQSDSANRYRKRTEGAPRTFLRCGPWRLSHHRWQCARPLRWKQFLLPSSASWAQLLSRIAEPGHPHLWDIRRVCKKTTSQSLAEPQWDSKDDWP